jgi:hypothetical protein
MWNFISKFTLLGIVVTILVMVISWWMIFKNSKDFIGMLLKARYWVGRSFGVFLPEDSRLQLQMDICHHNLEKISPTNVLREYLEGRCLPAAIQQSSLTEFYEKTLRNDEGIRSSILNHREGKTITCLSVLSKIEKEHDSNSVFIYADVRLGARKDCSITQSLTSILGVQDGENIKDVLNCLSKFEHGYRRIYAIIDQVDEWQPEDMEILRSWVIQDFTNLRINLPTANRDVAEKIDKVNGKKDALFLGEAMPTLRHDLEEYEVRNYVNLLTDDKEMRRTIKARAKEHSLKKNFGYITARQLVEIYKDQTLTEGQ